MMVIGCKVYKMCKDVMLFLWSTLVGEKGKTLGKPHEIKCGVVGNTLGVHHWDTCGNKRI
jgi:hypothetical protein